MGTFAKHIILCHMTPAPPQRSAAAGSPHRCLDQSAVIAEEKPGPTRRWTLLATALTASAGLGLRQAAAQPEQRWGTRSFTKEKFFQPGLTPEEAVARIRQTAEGMKEMRHMLETMSWRYVMFYVRLKSAYLDADLKTAMAAVPDDRRRAYVKTANEVVDNMSELDRYIRSPKVYESYLYYEKTLKSLDELVELLA